MIPVFGEVTCLSILVDVATPVAVAKSVATFREVRERFSRLDKETNEHVARALLRAHYKGAKEVFKRAKEKSTDGASLLPNAPLPNVPPQPTFDFINAQIRILADELPKERLQILQDEWRKALDASLSEYDASPANAAEDFHFRLAEAAGKQFKHDIDDWHRTSPDAAEWARQLFTAENGYPSLFRAALWQEFNSNKRPEFRKVYGALLQRETAQGIAALQDSHDASAKAILARFDNVERLIGDSTRLLWDQADQQHEESKADRARIEAKVDKIAEKLADETADPATRAKQASVVRSSVAHVAHSPDTSVLDQAEKFFDGDNYDQGFALLMQSAATDAIARYRDIATMAQFVRIRTSVAAMQKVCAIAPTFADWIRLSRFAATAGNLGLAENAARQAQHAADNLREQSVAAGTLGGVLVAGGWQLSTARTSLETALEIQKQLTSQDAGNTEWQRDLSVSYEKIGDVQARQGQLGAALSSFESGLKIRRQLASQDAGNRQWQRDLSVSYNKIGDVQVAQGQLGAALSSFEAGLEIAEQLASQDVGNTEWQRDLSVSHNRIGDVQVRQGQLGAALSSFEAGLEIAKQLASQDAGNTAWRRDLWVSHNQIGDVHVVRGQLGAALSSFEAGLEIAEQLALQDAVNTDWRRDLSVSHNKIGDMQVEHGQLGAALSSYEAGLEITRQLASQDAGNTEWQRDLSISYDNIGDVQLAQGQLSDGLSSYEAGLEIAKRLASQDVGNTEWQRDLSISYYKIGDVQVRQGQLGDALSSYEAGLEIRRQLASQDAENTEWQQDLWFGSMKLALLPREVMPLERAIGLAEQGLKIGERLVALDPTNAVWSSTLQATRSDLAQLRAEQA